MKGTMIGKRIIAGMLVLALTIVLTGSHVSAAEKKSITYIKDFKLYIAENSNTVMSYDEEKEAQKARDWFEDHDYTMIEGNLNAGASGALKKEVGVYLGYSTTTERKEAVTDLAVMNEHGNYSVGEYEKILKEQKKMYADMVSDLQDMLKEYRTNVKNEVPTAIQARDFMNGYYDPDTDKRLGDILMTISDEDLKTLLMQSNGQVVLMMEDRLSYACDTKKSTWLDRMVELGSYKTFEKQALRACNNDIGKANKALDKKYKESAITLAENWEDIRQHIKGIREKAKSWGLENMTDLEVKAFFKSNQDNTDVRSFHDIYQLLRSLAFYAYEDKSLYDYFDQPVETFEGDGIRKLYPLVASLSRGQIAGVDQTVSFFTLIANALGASAFNDYKSGETQKMIDKMDSDSKQELENVEKDVNKVLDEWQEQEPISIYQGVDREIFKGGVAVTSTAHNFSDGEGRTWADALVEDWAGKTAAIGLAVSSALCATCAMVMSKAIPKIKDAITQTYYEQILDESFLKEPMLKTEDGYVLQWDGLQIDTELTYCQQSDDLKNIMFNKALNDANDIGYMGFQRPIRRYNMAIRLKLGFTIVSVALAVLDIVMTSITLIKYYNRSHVPIPPCMVDLSYNQEEQTSFINYKSVRDQNDDYGDVNGGGGKQWLALYQSHDEDAGNPILAPENGKEFKAIVQYGSSQKPKTADYAPLHLFGAPNTPQNLTFADGESGWSYNDGQKGTYLFFRRSSQVVAAEEPEQAVEEEATVDTVDSDTETIAVVKPNGDESDSADAVSGSVADVGTVTGLNTGFSIMIGILGAFAGFFIGFIVSNARKKKREKL